jgi:hypothetical protein
MFLMGDSLSPAMTAGEDRMETPEDVAVMLRLGTDTGRVRCIRLDQI